MECDAIQPAKPGTGTKTISLNAIGQLKITKGRVGRREKFTRCFECKTSDPALPYCNYLGFTKRVLLATNEVGSHSFLLLQRLSNKRQDTLLCTYRKYA